MSARGTGEGGDGGRRSVRGGSSELFAVSEALVHEVMMVAVLARLRVRKIHVVDRRHYIGVFEPGLKPQDHSRYAGRDAENAGLRGCYSAAWLKGSISEGWLAVAGGSRSWHLP